MRRWLLGEDTAKELGLDLTRELHRLSGFESVSFKVNGVVRKFAMSDIRRRALMEMSCKNCLELQMQVDALKAELGREPAEPLESVVRKFIDENYERTFDRSYSRRELLREIDSFLLETYNKRIHKWSPLWAYVIRECLGDRSKGFKKLQIRKKRGGS
jgi:hypothetical protein